MISVRVMVFNATFNNILVISWLSVLLVEETGVPGENNPPAAPQRDIYALAEIFLHFILIGLILVHNLQYGKIYILVNSRVTIL
jgi:hypothetical protein